MSPLWMRICTTPIRGSRWTIRVIRRATWRRRLGAFGRGSVIAPRVVIRNADCVHIGDRVHLAEFVHVWGSGGVTIGDNVIVGSHTSITTVTHDKSAAIYRDTVVEKPIHISEGVWIGTHAVIMPGVKIGARAIVGAGSVVTGDVQAASIVVGVPARVLEQTPPICASGV